MLDFATLESCSELTSEHAKVAASTSTGIRILLKRMSEVARPDEGCPKVLMAVARLVGQEWVEGDLRVELAGDEKGTTLSIMTEHGVGIRERLLPLTRFDRVPLDEFSRALELAPALALPLRITEEEGKIVLAPLLTPEDQMLSKPPPDFEVEDKSRGEQDRTTAPPAPGADMLHDHPTPPNGIAAPQLPPPDEIIENPDELRAASVGTATPVVPTNGDGPPSVHTRPTVRRMVAVDVNAIRKRDPRSEEED